MSTEKQIPLGEATEAQLRTFAQDYLGMVLHPNTKADTLRAKIDAAWNKEHILVKDDAAEAPALQEGQPPRPVTVAQKPAAKGMVKLMIQRTDEAGGDEHVFAAVNGRGMLIPRGEWVEVPRPYYEVIRNAVKDIPIARKEGGFEEVSRKVPAYPFQLAPQ